MSDWLEERRKRDEARHNAVMALPVLQLRRHGAVSSIDPEDVLVSVSLGPAGQAVGLWSTAEDREALLSTTTQPGGATFPDSRPPRPVGARVTVHAPVRSLAARIASLPLAHPTVQVLPDGLVLVVAARCHWRPSGPDRNAIVYDAEGRVVTSQTLGDGIEHVLATASGRIWVGYFDEGVYGNYGWGGAGAPAPVGCHGLVRFSSDLLPEWQFPSHVDNLWGAISDCYALNVDGETAWTCYYTDFPLVRVEQDQVQGWRNSAADAARALLVGDTHVVLYGGYGPDQDRLVVARLGDNQLHRLSEYRVVLPDGSPVPASARVAGQGPDLHLFLDRDWYRLDLDSIPTA